MRNKFYAICMAGLVALAAVNVDVANKSEKLKHVNAKTTSGATPKNGENPPPPVKKIVYTYDASGNLIRRETVIVPAKGGDGTDSTKIDASGASMLKSVVSGAENTEIASVEFLDSENDPVEVSIYPNPTQGKLRVDITGVDIPQDARIEIFAANGSLMGTWSGISSSNTFDISNKPAGIYFLRLILDKDNISTWKIIKK